MKVFRIIGIALLVSVLASMAVAQSWTSVTNPSPQAVGPMLTLRDGRILAHSDQNGNANVWYILSPDSKGSYANGSWAGPYAMQSGYSPYYFSKAQFLDGKTVIVEGGEYNNGQAVWTTLGALGTYTPWGPIVFAANNPPTGWSRLGDAEADLMANGQYLQSNCCTNQTALYCGPNCWTASGSVHQGNNDESGFTALPNGLVLTVDTKSAGSCGTTHGYELYNPGTGTWACGGFGNLPTQLFNSGDEELGTGVLMYNGKVIQNGGNVVATNIYDPVADTWSVGPTPPAGLDQADGPSALEPNGKVLSMMSPGLFNSGCHFVEYDPGTNTMALTVDSPQCPGDSSYEGHEMILPTGQIASVSFGSTIYLYNPASGVVNGVAPTIVGSANYVAQGSKNNVLYGKQLNGLSEDSFYGDDDQAASNYPLVQFTDVNNGNVWFAWTHDDSNHSIAPGNVSYTKYDLNPAMPLGTYNMVVITNGIKSNAIRVGVVSPHL